MSPTIFKKGQYRFYFNSREELRMHVHVESNDGEAKFWLQPIVCLADNYNLKPIELREIQKMVEENVNEITKRWKKHFS
jgi:calcineurin-like phosphoesterase family protein